MIIYRPVGRIQNQEFQVYLKLRTSQQHWLPHWPGHDGPIKHRYGSQIDAFGAHAYALVVAPLAQLGEAERGKGPVNLFPAERVRQEVEPWGLQRAAGTTGAQERALASGAKGQRFESSRARQAKNVNSN